MRATDTNLLVRLIVRDDPQQAAKAESFIERGAWVSHLALAEAMWVLDAVYQVEAPQIATAVEMLLNHKTISIQDAEVVTAALELFRRNPKLSFSDCLLLEIARKAGHLPLGTFDRNLGKLQDTERI